jgi:monofunctional biosynthetic peptidoglycan transglycosylase
MRADPAWRWNDISTEAQPVRNFRFLRVTVWVIVVAVLLPLPFIAAYRFLPPPWTPLMLIRTGEGEPLRQHWVPLDRISPALVRAVVASEDAKFCHHKGFDWDALDEAWDDYQAGQSMRGGSTITMQTAKNLFLWPGRNFIRKGIEAYLTVLIEAGWPKQRIMETYLNIIEWGHGIYGADMAAQVYFKKSAAALSNREAALLAAVLPNPRRLSVANPTAYVEGRASTIFARMPQVATPSPFGCR